MWGGWALSLGERLDVATRRPSAATCSRRSGSTPPAVGCWPARRSRSRRWPRSGRRSPRSSAAGARASRRRGGRSRRPGSSRTRSLWRCRRRIVPALFGALRVAGRLIAVATTDDRAPTEATLRALGVRGDVAAIACGDDGVGVKPDPAMLLALCQATGVWPARTGDDRRHAGRPGDGPGGRGGPGRGRAQWRGVARGAGARSRTRCWARSGSCSSRAERRRGRWSLPDHGSESRARLGSVSGPPRRRAWPQRQHPSPDPAIHEPRCWIVD